MRHLRLLFLDSISLDPEPSFTACQTVFALNSQPRKLPSKLIKQTPFSSVHTANIFFLSRARLCSRASASGPCARPVIRPAVQLGRLQPVGAYLTCFSASCSLQAVTMCNTFRAAIGGVNRCLSTPKRNILWYILHLAFHIVTFSTGVAECSGSTVRSSIEAGWVDPWSEQKL